MSFFSKKSPKNNDQKSKGYPSAPPPYSEKPDKFPSNQIPSTIQSVPPMYPGQQPMYPTQQPMKSGQLTAQQVPGPPQPAYVRFDAGARFNPNQPIVIPPPPPGAGILPGQMAAYMGQPVIAVQNKSDFWNGGSSGGAVLY